ncbi:recombinase family protein [Aestuariivirga sp.]|uniref:recombinase family protein n=1 Tax=Aestuariivirga sp. TaxID=2650926 RepID=UPI0035931BA9
MTKSTKSLTKAVGYTRQSSAANVGADKDSETRQRTAITGHARAHGYDIVGWYCDAAVSGADPITDRPGFSEMLTRLIANGAKTVIVESPDRFARDLMVQLTGHDLLKAQGITLIPASAPDFFAEDTPTAVLVRQVLGAIAQFDKATTVAKLAAARKRKREANGKCEGRKSIAEREPKAVARARELASVRKMKPSLRSIAATLADEGFHSSTGQPFTAKTVASMLA